MITIRKYGNRRLYDTSGSRYINLEDLAKLIRDGETVQVVDARTAEDLTQSVLLQTIMEVQGGLCGLPTGMLHRLIRYGGDSTWSRALMQQLSLGLDMLDTQIAQFEQRFSPPRPQSRPADAGAAAPPAEEEAPKAKRKAKAKEAEEPEVEEEDAPPEARPPQDAELSALRDRLANLEKRLKK